MIDEAIGIGCDWGTTSFRAYLLGKDAQIIEKIEAQKGIMSIKDCLLYTSDAADEE